MPADKNFENRHLHFLDAISFIGENFTKHNLNIFSKMYGTYFPDWSVLRSQHIKSSDAFWKFFACKVYKEVLGYFPDFCVSKQSCLPWSSDAFFELSVSNIYKIVLGAFSRFLHPKTKLLAVKSRRILEVFTLQVKNVLGAFSRFLRPKTKVFPLNFRRILEVLCLQVLQKKFWAQFHELCVQKRSCLLWSSDAF